MKNRTIIIVGGGITGLLTALSLSRLGFAITVIERNSFYLLQDSRSFAIAANSKEILEEYGVWQEVATETGPINEIRITHNNSPLFLHFDNKEMAGQPMGYMVPAGLLINVIYQKLLTMQNVSLLSKVNYQAVNFQDGKVVITLDSNEILEADLLICAEGKHSSLRDYLNIKTTYIPYNQTAVVFNIKHEYSHNCTAIENFYLHGPLALLPLKDELCSAIVWTVEKGMEKILYEIEEKELIELIQTYLENCMGNIELITPIKTFDLTAIFANNYYYNRAVLIGDAAHTIHPIAGQGLNLTIRDIDLLTNLIKEQYLLGLDIGSVQMLEKYSKIRKRDNNAMFAATDICNRIFGCNSSIISLAAKIGMVSLNNFPSLKKLFINYAMGFRDN